MNSSSQSAFEIPSSLKGQLRHFRNRLWVLKLVEACAFSVIGFLLGFCIVFGLDRLVDTPKIIRWGVLGLSVLASLSIPFALERWIWRRRRFEQLARLLAQEQPIVGDQILGVLQLADDTSEQQRSPHLVEAAIRQVGVRLEGQDFAECLAHPRTIRRVNFMAALLAVSFLLFAITSDAATNALVRFTKPWSDVDRYTFAQLKSVSSPMVVAKGETINFQLEFDPMSRWRPDSAQLKVASAVRYSASETGGLFQFELPGQIDKTTLDYSVGDYHKQIVIEPVARPEMKSLVAAVELPAYLQRKGEEIFEVRGGTLSILEGSRLSLSAEMSRDLISAEFNTGKVEPDGNKLELPEIHVLEDNEIRLDCVDRFGLAAENPLRLQLEAIEDQLPTLVCENLPLRKVLLTNEVLALEVRAYDDFGVGRVGLQWSEANEEGIGNPLGESLLGAGGPEVESLELKATFSAADLMLETSFVAVRAFVEDYHPTGHRQYSTASFFQILDNAEHAVWWMSDLGRWQQTSLDVRDRELQLHQTNLELQGLPDEELATASVREKIAKQAEQERAHGRQLANLVRAGEGLRREAMRNAEICAESLEDWAEMVQVLKEISSNRMPKVAELLDRASKAGNPGGNSEEKDSLQAGQNRLQQTAGGDANQKPNEEDEKPSTPSVSDIESSQLDLENLPKGKTEKQKSQQGRLGLADTKLAGNAASESESSAPTEELDQAVTEQEGLLDEFEKVSGQLNEIMGNLEGSTLVKRLKSASRKQQQIAVGLSRLIANDFGVPDREKHADRDAFVSLADMESKASLEVSNLMDDMTAYFERSRQQLLQRVLQQMKSEDVTAGLRDLGMELRKQNGLSISQAEYWSDNLDRWAEDLVEVTQSGASPGGKPKGSLPPGIVLEVLQILDSEVQLREQTRVAEQKRSVVTDTEHMNDANRLGELQQSYQERVDSLVDQILDLPNAEGDFANELNLLGQVSGVMQEATEILYKPQTGPTAIAAETEAIELLLKSKRFNPNASGGSGADPGGGGSGDTEVAALALVGAGVNAKETTEESEVTQATGLTDPGLPEEFRGGLDQYFERLEGWKGK